MTLTRKDYEATATVIKGAYPVNPDYNAVTRGRATVLKQVAEGLADMFAKDNGRFDCG